MSFAGPLEDRLLIRELMGSYDDAVFRSDVDAWLDLWCEDCVWRVADSEYRGKAALRAEWVLRWRDLKKMSFLTQIGAIEVRGDLASVRCYCHETLLLKQGGLRKLIGRYDDKLRREGGHWRLAQRHYRFLLDEGAGALLPVNAGR